MIYLTGPGKKKRTYEIKTICPFKPAGNGCHHPHGDRDSKTEKKVCRFSDTQADCPLYKRWLERMDEQFENDLKKKKNTISKKTSVL